MSRPLVVVSHTLPNEWIASLRQDCDVVVGPETSVDSDISAELLPALEQADGLLTLLTVPVNESLLNRAPNLKVISNMAVGVDNIDLAACTTRNIPVGNTPGVLTEATADLTLALLLAAARRLPEAAADARAGLWTTWNPTGWLGTDLNGATLGIVGLGKIGTAVAERATPFGLRLVHSSRGSHLETEARLNITRLPFDELLAQSDIVSLHVPLSAETRGLVNERALRLMKSSAILVNVARGPVVDSTALYRALTEGWIAAAALDVTDPEPLPADSPLHTLPNCLIVPHIGSATHQTRRRMATLACDNILAGLAGKRLPHCANPDVYGSGDSS